jgi:hypothetical protein
MHYRLFRQDGPWFVYEQVGKNRLTSLGYVMNAPCESGGYANPREGGNALRVRQIPGGRLRVDFGYWEDVRSDPLIFYFAGESGPVWRSYLHHAG